MFLKSNKRFKNGKNHTYWNIVENQRVSSGRTVQRQILYLGVIKETQQEAWSKSIEVFEEGQEHPKQMYLFASDQAISKNDINSIQVKLNELEIKKPRQWGACWLFSELWSLLELDVIRLKNEIHL